MKDELPRPSASLESVGVLSLDQLNAALKEAVSRVARAESEIERWKLQLVAATREEVLIDELIRIRSGEEPLAVASSVAGPRVGGIVNHPLVDAVVAALRDARRPLHISELMQILATQNVEIPGSGMQANVISYLRRDGRIVRPRRGLYGLADWALERDEMVHQPVARKKRVRVVTRRSRTQ